MTTKFYHVVMEKQEVSKSQAFLISTKTSPTPLNRELYHTFADGDGAQDREIAANRFPILLSSIAQSMVTCKLQKMVSTETTILYVSWIFFVPGNVARSWSLLHIAKIIIVISVNINANDLNTFFVRAYRNKAKKVIKQKSYLSRKY